MASMQPKMKFQDQAWAIAHDHALGSPRTGFERIGQMLELWAGYAMAHRSRYDSSIGDDGVLGDYWKDIGLGIRGLLNGETGRLDCGTLDAFILDTLKENGIDTENL